MAEPQYRYGGPVPERAQWLKKRREWRTSSLFARVKRGRARDREETAKAGDVSKQMAMAAEMTPYLHGAGRADSLVHSSPMTDAQHGRLRAAYLTALQGRPGKEPSPWIAHPASAPKSGRSTALYSRFRSAIRAAVARVRALHSARPE